MSEQTARSTPASASSWLSKLLRLLVLLVLVGVGAAGYIYVWPEVEAFRAKQADVEENLASLAKADVALANDLTALIGSELEKSEDATLARLQSAVTRLSAELNDLRDIEQRAAEKLNEAHHLLYRMSKTDQRAWQLAEAAFNIRLASQRLQFANDVSGALTLLSQADALLQADSNEVVSTVRSAIAFDRAQLKTVQKLDVVGLMGRLSALDRQIQTLDLTTFEPSIGLAESGTNADVEATQRPAEMKASQTLWEQSLETLSSYFVITELESFEQKPRTADWAGLAKLSMKLNVEQARVALLARDSVSFTGALSRAASVLVDNPSSIDAPNISVIIDELSALSSLSLDLTLPRLESLKVINELGGDNSDVSYLGSDSVDVGSLVGGSDDSVERAAAPQKKTQELAKDSEETRVDARIIE